jgi:ribosomal protein L7Ae-like RNA K-turn-binding protein
MLRSFAAALIAALLGNSPAIAASAQPAGPVALLPLAPASTGLPYAPLPSPGELSDLTGQLRAGFAEGGVRVIPLRRVSLAVTSEGFAQDSLERSCAEARCAQAVGRAVGADAVAYGRVTRLMALIWTTQVIVIDVRTGKQLAALQGGYKGGPTEMGVGETRIGSCLARVLTGKTACKHDPGF